MDRPLQALTWGEGVSEANSAGRLHLLICPQIHGDWLTGWKRKGTFLFLCRPHLAVGRRRGHMLWHACLN